MSHPSGWGSRVLSVAAVVVALASQAEARTTSASTTNADGTTTTITKNPDGTTTRTITGQDGQVIRSEPVEPTPVTKVPPRAPGTSGSTTDADGNTITIKKNPDGTTTKTVTSPDGQVLSSGPMAPEPPTTVPPRTPGTSASATDANGNTTTITKHPDGTTTRTVTGPDGRVISSGPVEPEPPTKVPPRTPGTSGSTTDADGNTITIRKNPDGTTTRTVTDPSGRVITSGPITPPPTGAQLLYNTATNGDRTANVAMVLKREEAKTLLEASVLVTGKGTNFRTWVPEKVALLLGKEKLKPVSTKPYYVQKESLAARVAPILFAAIAMQYAAGAEKAESSKGTPCPLTGKVEGEQKKEERGKIGRAIDEAGMVAGVSLLASQAKGELEGRRVTFDVSGREDQLLTGTLLLRVVNTDMANTNRINLANESSELLIKVPVNFKAERNLLLTVRPTLIRESGDEP